MFSDKICFIRLFLVEGLLTVVTIHVVWLMLLHMLPQLCPTVVLFGTVLTDKRVDNHGKAVILVAESENKEIAQLIQYTHMYMTRFT